MARQSDYAIRSAIEGCLARCRQSAEPLGCLGEEMDRLRERLWPEADVSTVEHAVLKVLLRVLVTRYVERSEIV